MKKFELLERESNGLCRIRALKDFGEIKKGEIGGYVENEHNLSQEGNCWIDDDARVHENAQVREDAVVRYAAEVFGRAIITNSAAVSGGSKVHDDALVSGTSCVYENARVYGKARVRGNSQVYGAAEVFGNATTYGDCEMRAHSRVCGNAIIGGNASINDNAFVGGMAMATAWTQIEGSAELTNGVHTGYLNTECEKVIYVQCETRLITIYKRNGVQYCNIGCQHNMTLDQLEQRIVDDGGMKPHRQQYVDLMTQINL